MNINFLTDHLLISHYPFGAGGKFIQMSLALHSRFLFQDELLAQRALDHGLSINERLKIALWPLNRKFQKRRHIEYGCTEMAGFNGGDLENDITSDMTLSNKLWKQLTNQKEFYFFMVDTFTGKTYSRYINRKTIMLINYNWILESRNLTTGDSMSELDVESPNVITFDMESIKDPGSFVNEIYKIFDWLGIEQPAHRKSFDAGLDDLRRKFLESLTIGFELKEE
jgi:hypothetical protein